MKHAYVTVDYDESKPETYRGIVIELPDGEVHRINTGDFNRDYQRTLDEYTPFAQSSMVDNFRFDLKQK